MEPFIVGIRFQRVGKVYHFDASDCRDIKIGDYAVVETSRGRQLGEVIQVVESPTPPPEGTWKPIHHRATPRDLVLRQLWQKKELEAMINCRAKLAEFRIPGVKIVGAEFTFDGSRLSFLYSTEGEGKVDLRRLQTAMQRIYPNSRVDMRQMGPRDVAKLLGGMGACGMENRCCSMFLTEFSPISIKMAKEQGISLTPTEITGMCGRLRCCLIYEYEQYVEARKSLPKRNKRVVTPSGEGKVIDTYPLKGTVIVELDAGTRVEVAHADLQPWDELEALRRKSQAPCDRHEGGGCTCGQDRGGPSAESQVEKGEPPEVNPADAELMPPADTIIDLSQPVGFDTVEGQQPADQPSSGAFRKKKNKNKGKKFSREDRPTGEAGENTAPRNANAPREQFQRRENRPGGKHRPSRQGPQSGNSPQSGPEHSAGSES